MKKILMKNTFFMYSVKLINRNKKILNQGNRPTKNNHVNLHWWSMMRKDGKENFGDYLSYEIVQELLKKKGLSLDTPINQTKHLYGIGSIIQGGAQNATIWGSGLKNGNKDFNLLTRLTRKLDVRLVRGPQTREVLLANGYDCPEKYGDPALILPLLYQPENIEKTKDYLVILHHDTTLDVQDYLSPICHGYKGFIDELNKAKLVISSSLHGIILAETYGIPAILLMDKVTNNIFKYNDYYYSTGRFEYPIARTVEEALKMKPAPLPDLSELRNNILEAFPYDLWENKKGDK